MFVLLASLISVQIKQLAYLDPGSGSLIIQLLIAALLGLGVLVRAQWSKIKSLFGQKKKSDEDQDDDEE